MSISIQGIDLVGSTSDGKPMVTSWAMVDYTLSGGAGQVVVNWAYLESIVFELTQVLLKHNGTKLAGGIPHHASKRLRLLNDQWRLAFDGHSGLIERFDGVMRKIWDAKVVRDRLCHWRMTLNHAESKYMTFED